MINNIMKEIEIHQCLYGYESGHRLLASSINLPHDVATTLLLLSDLAPGLMLPSNGGYWTGIPLPTAKVYALMYTWMAYEMPRPGCVWSHVLLIPFPEMARIQDLSILCQYISRPKLNSGFDMYNNSIILSPNFIKKINYSDIINSESIKKIINAIYNLSGKVKLESSLDDLDSSIFRIWSQQWPRLRRSFSFRTLSAPNGITSDKNRFDISIIKRPNNSSSNETIALFEKTSDWEKYAIDDAMSSTGKTFRKYLWRYGTDIISGRKSFKYISVLYLHTFERELKGEVLFNFLKKIIYYFPSNNEAKILKQDIISNGKYSFFPPINKLDLLIFYILNNINDSLPSLSDDIFYSIHLDWHDRKVEILSIGEMSVGNSNPLCIYFLNELLLEVEKNNFFSLTNNTPKLRKHLLFSKPSLMDNDEFIHLKISEQIDCINIIPFDDLTLAESILLRIINIDNYELVSTMYLKFKELTTELVFLSFEYTCSNAKKIISDAWIEIIDANPTSIIKGNFIPKSQSTIALYKYFSILKSSNLLFSIDIKDWTLPLNSIIDNIEGKDRVELILYLFGLGLKKASKDCEVIFESFFEEIHDYFENSVLCDTQSEVFLDQLPYLGWFSNWDNCQRLRTAIVNTYVYNNLSTKSFMLLTKRKDIYLELISILSKTKDGEAFLDKLVE